MIAGAVFSGMLKFMMPIAIPLAIKEIIDNVVGGTGPADERIDRLYTICTVLAGVMVVQAVATYFRSFLVKYAGTRVIFDLRCALYEHLQRLSLRFFEEQRTGAIVSRLLADINAAQQFMNSALVTIAMDTSLMAIVIVILFRMNVTMSLWAIGLLPIYLISYRYINPRVRAATKSAQNELAEMSGDVTERLGAMMVVQAFTQEKREAASFRGRNEDYTGFVLTRVKLSAFLQSVTSFVTELSPIIVLWVGATMAVSGTTTAGELVAFYGLLGMLYGPIRRLSDVNVVIQTAIGALERVFEFFDETPDIRSRKGAEDLESVVGHVEFRDVSFSYDPELPVLRHVGFTVKPGQAVALVGASGSGKSTIAKLVTRFYDVDSGQILVDGTDVRDVTMKSLRKQIGIVPQRSMLFRGSIRENIMYGRPRATADEVVAAAKAASAHEFILEQEDGYETEVGEQGVQLSGGQAQRIALARTFLKDPRILILDEATSALDSASENAIQDALRRLMKGRTTFIIAHRLTTIVDADFILVVQDGRITERGTHTGLLQRGEAYADVCEQQFGPMLRMAQDAGLEASGEPLYTAPRHGM